MKLKFIIFLILIFSLPLLLASCDAEQGEVTEESETLAESEQATEHKHSFGEWNTTKRASCTAGGTEERVCSECEYTEQQPLEKIAHTFIQTMIFPTCTSRGYTNYKCEHCDYEYQDKYVNALSHEIISNTTLPTCTSQGYTDHECQRCDYELRDSYVDPLAHDFKATVTRPTILQDGYTTYTCDCSHVETSDYVSYSEIFESAYVQSSEVLANGIDVSKWNHETNENNEYLPLDWNSIKASGVDFVILKGGSTKSGIEPTFEMDYAAARAAGLQIGVYFYTYSTTSEGIEQDAQLLLSALDGKYFEYPIYLDLEDVTLEDLGKDVLMKMCTTFITTLQANGYYAALYTNNNWLTNMLDRDAIVLLCDVWYARYPNTDVPVWNEEKYGKQVGMWQYSQSGKIDGFECDFDLNYAYKNYKEIMVKWELNGFSSEGPDLQAPELSESEP